MQKETMMHILCCDEKMSVKNGFEFFGRKNKRQDDENPADDEPARKKKMLMSAPVTCPGNSSNEVSVDPGGSTGGWHWLPGKVEDQLMGGKSNKPAGGFLDGNPPEAATFQMDCGEISEENQTDSPKLYLSESASARLSEVFKLESVLKEAAKTEVSELAEASKETKCAVNSVSAMETDLIEQEKMPELYYYM